MIRSHDPDAHLDVLIDEFHTALAALDEAHHPQTGAPVALIDELTARVQDLAGRILARRQAVAACTKIA